MYKEFVPRLEQRRSISIVRPHALQQFIADRAVFPISRPLRRRSQTVNQPSTR